MEALRERLAGVEQLSDATALLRYFEDLQLGFRPIAPSEDRPGWLLFWRWARGNLRWADLEGHERADVVALTKDASDARGEVVCLRGRWEMGVLHAVADGREFLHRVDLVNREDLEESPDVTVCGVLLGRVIDRKDDDVDDASLHIVGMIRSENLEQ